MPFLANPTTPALLGGVLNLLPDRSAILKAAVPPPSPVVPGLGRGPDGKLLPMGPRLNFPPAPSPPPPSPLHQPPLHHGPVDLTPLQMQQLREFMELKQTLSNATVKGLNTPQVNLGSHPQTPAPNLGPALPKLSPGNQPWQQTAGFQVPAQQSVLPTVPALTETSQTVRIISALLTGAYEKIPPVLVVIAAKKAADYINAKADERAPIYTGRRLSAEEAAISRARVAGFIELRNYHGPRAAYAEKELNENRNLDIADIHFLVRQARFGDPDPHRQTVGPARDC